MKENQNTNLITSKELPSFAGMSLLAILRQGSGMLLKEAIEAEITEHLGRMRYQHGEEFRGHRNGHQKTQMDTSLGPVEYDRPKVAYAEGFESRYHTPHMRRPEEFASAVADMYVGGVSTRKVKDALKAVAGEKIRLSKNHGFSDHQEGLELSLIKRTLCLKNLSDFPCTLAVTSFARPNAGDCNYNHQTNISIA